MIAPSRRRVLAGAAAATALPVLGCTEDRARTARAGSASPRLVMWGAALMAHPLQTRLDAVAQSGFTHMTVFPADVARWRGGGMSDRQITRAIRASGVGIATIDPYTGWVPGWSLEGLDDFTRDFIGYSEEEVFAMAETLETEQVNCVESAGAPYDQNAYADALAAFAERASAHGLATTLEFMPTSKITDLAAGWSLIEASGAGVGLTFDTWHFWRSDPDHALLASIPMERIVEVQVADADETITGDLQMDLLYHRKPPGEGDFDLDRTMAVLRGMGPIRSIGPETFSEEMNATPAAEAVRRNAEGLAAVVPTLAADLRW